MKSEDFSRQIVLQTLQYWNGSWLKWWQVKNETGITAYQARQRLKELHEEKILDKRERPRGAEYRFYDHKRPFRVYTGPQRRSEQPSEVPDGWDYDPDR